MHAAEALLDPVGVPRQVVVHHQVGDLKIHAFTRCIGRHQNGHVRVLAELFLCRDAVLSARSTVNLDDGGWFADDPGDLLPQVVERVLVLRKDDQLLSPTIGPQHLLRVALKDRR